MSSTRPDAEETRDVPIEVAQHVLWHFGDHLGQEPGDFIARLLMAFAKADMANFAKLALAYPEYAHAFHAVAREAWGLEWLRGQVAIATADKAAS